MASEADKKKAQELVEEADRLHLEAKNHSRKEGMGRKYLSQDG